MILVLLILFPLVAFGEEPLPAPAVTGNFVSTVELSVVEEHSATLERSRKRVLRELHQMADDWQGTHENRFEIQSNGNQVMLYLLTEEDARARMQQAMSQMILNLTGIVQLQGVTRYYRASGQPKVGAYLEVNGSDKKNGIHWIYAKSVPLRDVLREIKSKFKDRFSYSVPGECADMPVNWSFGRTTKSRPKGIDVVMAQLAEDFGLRTQREKNTFILTDQGCLSRRAEREFFPAIIPISIGPRQWQALNADTIIPLDQ